MFIGNRFLLNSIFAISTGLKFNFSMSALLIFTSIGAPMANCSALAPMSLAVSYLVYFIFKASREVLLFLLKPSQLLLTSLHQSMAQIHLFVKRRSCHFLL